MLLLDLSPQLKQSDQVKSFHLKVHFEDSNHLSVHPFVLFLFGIRSQAEAEAGPLRRAAA